MRPSIAVPLMAALTLSACNKADKPKSEDEVKTEIARMAKPMPGLYRSSSKVISFEMPGMPPAQAERMKQMFATSQQSRDFCLTKAEADKGYEEMTKKLAEGNCTYDRFTTSGNSLDARLTCQNGKEMKASIEMKGTISEEGSRMTMSVDQAAPHMPNGGAMKMVAEVVSQRIGDCPGA